MSAIGSLLENKYLLGLAALAAGYWFWSQQSKTSTFYNRRREQFNATSHAKDGGMLPSAANGSPSAPASASTFYNNRGRNNEGFYRATSVRSLGMM